MLQAGYNQKSGVSNKVWRVARNRYPSIQMPKSKNPQLGKASRFTGVFRSGSNKWKAQLQYKNQCLYLGTFEHEEEAAMVYQREKARITALDQGVQQPQPLAPVSIETVKEAPYLAAGRRTVSARDDTPRPAPAPVPSPKQSERVLLLIPISRVSELRQAITTML